MSEKQSTKPLNQQQKKDLMEAKELAAREQIPVPIAAMRKAENNIRLPHFWSDPRTVEEGDHTYADVDIISHCGWLGEFAQSVAASIQFPANTAMAHLLGVLSAATAKSFRYLYFSNTQKSCNLYIVTAQPSSSGKSGVHDQFSTPCRLSLEKLNREMAAEQVDVQLKIESIEKSIKAKQKGGEDVPENEIRELTSLIEQRDQLNRLEFSFDDITPEAAESAAIRQNGLINITSAEADALNIILGSVYKNEGSKANYGMFLKTWDTEWHSPSRITRDTKSCHVYGSVAVIAQEEAVNSILEAGQSGRGISERMLLLRERPVMGHRNFREHHPIDKKLQHEYRQLIENVIMEREIQELKLSQDAIDLIIDYRQSIESKLADDGEYGNNMIRGAMGKADKQIIKISSLLHIAKYWPGQHPTRKLIIEGVTVSSAIEVFKQLSQTYILAAESLGYAGIKTELNCLIESLERSLTKNHKGKLSMRQLRDSVKNLKAMKNVPNLTTKLKEKHIPKLEELGYIVTDGSDIYINPKLR